MVTQPYHELPSVSCSNEVSNKKIKKAGNSEMLKVLALTGTMIEAQGNVLLTFSLTPVKTL